jgi:hypothetical protein
VIVLKTYDDAVLGTIGLTGAGLTGSTPAAQELADVVTQRHNGDVVAAYNALDGWQNGYLYASSDSDAAVVTRGPDDTDTAVGG